jgi:hypothetical protein
VITWLADSRQLKIRRTTQIISFICPEFYWAGGVQLLQKDYLTKALFIVAMQKGIAD